MDVNFVLCSVLVRFTVSRSVEAPSTGTVAVGCAVVVVELSNQRAMLA